MQPDQPTPLPKRELTFRALPPVAAIYVAAVIASGAVACVVLLLPLRFDRPLLFAALLLFGCLASTWKVNLPASFHSGSTLSVSYSADLMALLLLGPAQATLIALAGVWTQCTVKAKRPYPLYRTVFSTGAEAITMWATSAAYVSLDGTVPPVTMVNIARPIVGAIATYFLVNTLLIAGAMALSTRERVLWVWRDNFLWSAPAFMVAGGAGAFAAVLVARGDHWIAILLAAPIYLTFRTYRVFLDSVRALAQKTAAERALASETERLSVVLGSIADGVIATDLVGRVRLLNRAAEMLSGWTQAEAEARPLEEVYRSLDPEKRVPYAQTMNAPAVGTAPAPRRRRAMLVARDGMERPIEEASAPLRDSEGRTIGMVIAFSDITDTIRAQQEQEKASRLASLGVLAGGIAHDFNNILAAIMGNVSLARIKTRGDPDADEVLIEAEHACARARQLTRQLVTFAKGGAPVKKPIRLDRLIRESATLALAGSNVRYVLHVEPGLWAVEADEGQLLQVFNNVLLNAQQAMPDGGSIEVRAQNVPEPENRWEFGVLIKAGPYVRVSIADRGEGIPDEVLGRIFEPYFSTKAKGSGLGLATAYSIVTNHGGFISVDSTVGRGTTVHVRLPAVLSAAVEDAGEAPGVAHAGRGRVLILDDEEPVRIVARKMLAALGYECETVSEGGAAIARYKQARAEGRPFDLAILDLTIPGGVGGKDVIRALVELDPQVKAVVASGYTQDDVMARFRDYGFKAVVAKPFNLQELTRALEDVART